MALLFMDSFDHYVTADLAAKWTTVDSGGTYTDISATSGRRSGGAVRSGNSASNSVAPFVTKTLAPADATIILGCAVKPTTINADYPLFTVGDNSAWHGGLYGAGGNTLNYRRGPNYGGTVLGATSALTTGSFTYLEIRVTISDTVGVVTVRFNGTTVLTLTSQDTKDATLAGWTRFGLHSLQGTAGTANVVVDDLYVLDGSGAAPWNAVLGDVRVDARYPTGAGATTGWTPSAGANWAAVDDATPNGDTDYVIATTSGLVDTYVVQDAPVAGGTILGVQHCLNIKKMDASTCTVAPVIRHSSTNYVGADLAPSTAYGYGLQIAATNPGTSAAWVEADFNNAEFGFKRTS